MAKLEEKGNVAYLNNGMVSGEKRERIASNEMCTFLIFHQI